MMCDILRTLKQFTGNLKNVQVNLVEASPNLMKVQQDKLLKFLQDDLNIFMSFQMPQNQQKVDRFQNKDQNLSISWYPSLKDYYNEYLKVRLELVQSMTKSGKKAKLDREQAQVFMKNPCFVLAHELYDALPIHQFQYS